MFKDIKLPKNAKIYFDGENINIDSTEGELNINEIEFPEWMYPYIGHMKTEKGIIDKDTFKYYKEEPTKEDLRKILRAKIRAKQELRKKYI